ncbi:unnamed protein product [Didymodactylos carnosus]|uniref:Cyclin-like domain-containing protein n=1 Tax=Didymodactylos carnosus TaxID=1234261 RepID=A0A813UQQ6_9BILA|nr:unnamed protein product [Didymodactylos carnosus]CAF0906181.1 unnamed protein product [Didymodactylos carnosus]CAF3613541.1 unnamed protein product [Didymodactylos carnosus]CAF3686040.1 unnamed protein product [Didymodactylos carnosus]
MESILYRHSNSLMYPWYFDKKELKNTPSTRDGIDAETERRYRHEGARFILDLGFKLSLRPETMGTGAVFFHRFYMFHSFPQFPRFAMATCCLFLSGKVEETPKKIRDIMKTARQILEGARERYIPTLGDEKGDLILQYERVLLPTVKFDFCIQNPYTYLRQYAKTIKGDKEQIRQMFQMAWTFVNDSYCTTLCLQWEPEIIAIAVMYLACKLSKFEITDWTTKKENTKQKWWEQFVDDICHQHLDLYSKNNSSAFASMEISGSNSQLSSTNPLHLSNTNTWTTNQTNSNVTSPVTVETGPGTPAKRSIRSDDDSYRNGRLHTSAEQPPSLTTTTTTDGRSSFKNEHDLTSIHIKQPPVLPLINNQDDPSRRSLTVPSLMMNPMSTQQQNTQQNQVSPNIWMNMRPPPSLLSMQNPFMSTHFPPFPPPLPLPPVPSFDTPKYHQSK